MQITLQAVVYGKTEYANRPGETHVTLDCGNNNMIQMYVPELDAATIRAGAKVILTISNAPQAPQIRIEDKPVADGPIIARAGE